MVLLDFLHLRSWDIAASPIGQELKRLGVAHRFLVAPVKLVYRRRAELLLLVYPRLLIATVNAAVRSLGPRQVPPSAVIVSSDIEALVFAAIRTLMRRRTLIVFQTLIITPRASRFGNMLYFAYWKLIMLAIDVGICHARSEIESYTALFPRHVGKLQYIPYGTTVAQREALLQTRGEQSGMPVIVTAGRSGRDYKTLAQAVEGLPCRLKIICDIASPLIDVQPSDQIEVVKNCFNNDYLKILSSAAFVVVPLAVNDISAGQMVLLQAWALGRAVILTQTATTIDYATDQVDTLLVPLGDAAALRAAISRLIEEPSLRERLGDAARHRFDRDHSTEAYIRKLVASIEARVREPCV